MTWLASFDFRFFWRIFIPFGVSVTTGIVINYQTDAKGRIAQMASEERSRLERHAASVAFRFDDLLSDLRLVANLLRLEGDLNTMSQVSIEKVQNELAVFVSSKTIYDQARYMDETGMERVRVDRAGEGRARIIPAQELQNKGQRYYFSDTIKLKDGQVYISPFDLNIERDQIEVPYKPMIRIATPLFTAEGKLDGVAALNYLGNDLLQRLEDSAGGDRSPLQLLNRDGHWLKGPDPDREWGFMFQRQDTFGTDHPGVWAAMQALNQGQIEEHGRLWTWLRIDLLPKDSRSSTGTDQAQGPSHATLHGGEYHWIAVSEMPASLDAQQNRQLIVQYLIMWLFYILFVGFTSSLIALRQGQLKLKNQQLADAARDLEFLAAHDPLTGVLNRRAFLSMAEIECARAQRFSNPIAVISADLDFFKRINDAHGHQMGDRVLKDFCSRSIVMLRPADVMARFGGEEFVMMLPDTDLMGAKQVADRLRQEIEIQRDPSLPSYTVSFGVAAWTGPPSSVIKIEILLNRADDALYRAKSSGRNKVILDDAIPG